MLYSEVRHRPRIRHKSLASENGGTVGGDNLARDNLAGDNLAGDNLATDNFASNNFASDNFANSDKEIIMVQALPIRSNRTKSTLDKLVREPELGRLVFGLIRAYT